MVKTLDSLVETTKKENGYNKHQRLIVFILSIYMIVFPFIFFIFRNVFDNSVILVKLPTEKVLPPPPPPDVAQCNAINDTSKFDCFPRGNASEKSCLERGCCWIVPKNATSSQVPYCFYPGNYALYKYLNVSSTDYGVSGYLNATFSSPYPSNIDILKIDVKFETESRLHIKISDPIKKRYEPPIPEVPILETATKNAKYSVNINRTLPGFNVVRRSNNQVIFESTSSGFTFSDQFLQLSALLPTNNIYGLGVHRNNFLLNTNWQTITMLNRDQPPNDNMNLYATHPFFIAIENDGSCFGVLLLNSNPMDRRNTVEFSSTVYDSSTVLLCSFLFNGGVVGLLSMLILWVYFYSLGRKNRRNTVEFSSTVYDSSTVLLCSFLFNGGVVGLLSMLILWVYFYSLGRKNIILQPAPAITYRTIGGIFDFYFFLGPSPLEVIEQYTELVGRPVLPPYWSLGFHLCRFGYQNLSHVQDILTKNLDAGIPVDTQWLDIDYMNKRNDFTHDKNNFKDIMSFVKKIHKEGRHFVVILDPGVSASEPYGTYPPYTDAIQMNVLVEDSNGRPILGKVWNPNLTAFPDFTHPNATPYWLKQVQRMYVNQFQFDGLWIDMNEPSNFVAGSVAGCPDNSLENPPYTPKVVGGMLRDKTLCMTAKHYWGNHYDVHNLVSMAQAVATNFALTEITKKRPFVISRSSFVGQGKYSGVWTGDIFSTWDDMYHSIPDILTYNLLGIPMVGADICGFNDNTSAALCQRWYQLGAFYPFSRTHNDDATIPQDPASLGPDVVTSFKKAYAIRYKLLPYLYTLFWIAHSQGHPVVRPLFFEFPTDRTTYPISKQFLWGSAVHIVPVLEEGMTYVKGYFPRSRWFDYYTYEEVARSGAEISIPAPLDTIPVFLKGGHIIPTQEPNVTTTLSRKDNFGLIVVPNEKGESNGTLFWDDGESIETYERGEYSLINFALKGNNLWSTTVSAKYNISQKLSSISVLGVTSLISKVIANKQNVKSFTYHSKFKHLEIRNLTLDLKEPFTVTWS